MHDVAVTVSVTPAREHLRCSGTGCSNKRIAGRVLAQFSTGDRYEAEIVLICSKRDGAIDPTAFDEVDTCALEGSGAGQFAQALLDRVDATLTGCHSRPLAA